jgi:ribonuclease HII
VADSKALTAQARERAYEQVVRSALDWSVIVIPSGDIDRLGLHVCNVSGMRRALSALACRPGYVLTDGFPVRGLAVPALAMWKGDQVAACVAAASVIAKVTRDRIMSGLHEEHPAYGFSRHKGYSTPSHMKALAEHGPCPEHRRSFVNVGGSRGGTGVPPELPLGVTLSLEVSLAGSGDGTEDRHNGPIVDVSGDELAGLAPATRRGG